MPVSGLSGLICLGGGIFGLFRGDKNNVNITQTNFMRFIFLIKSIIVAQLCRLPSNTAFPNTSNGLIFLRRSEAVVPRCFSKQMFLNVRKLHKKTPALESFQIKLQVVFFFGCTKLPFQSVMSLTLIISSIVLLDSKQWLFS